MADLALPIYLDGHATTPLAPEVAAAMSPWWAERAGNSLSPHRRGTDAALAVDRARAEIASLVGAAPTEVVFTSGATEANNLALLGVAEAAQAAGDIRRSIVVSAIEHKSVLGCAAELRNRGFEVTLAPVDSLGLIKLEALERLINDQTLLVSVMAANNEIGTLQPLEAVFEIARSYGAMIHVDAAQAAGKIPLNISEADFASLSAHKLYGPVGVGALFVSSAAPYRPKPLFCGGGQEGGLRAGTLPVPLVVGFGAAAALAKSRMYEDSLHCQRLATRFLENLKKRNICYAVNGSPTARLPGSLNLRIIGCDATRVISALYDRICLAEGSACTSGNLHSSHVLIAIGLRPEVADECVRIYFSRYNMEIEADFAATELASVVSGLAAGDQRQ